MVGELAKVTGADIGFLSDKGIFATSLSKFESDQLFPLLKNSSERVLEILDRIAARHPILDSGGKVLGNLVVMKSLRVFYEQRRMLFLISAMVLSVVVILAVLFSMLTSRSIVQPLQVLTSAFRDVGEGNLETQVSIHSGDELENLSNTFNDMVLGLRKKETMSKFLTGMEMEEVDAISAGTKDISMFGDKRTISILFCDIRSFTTLCENYDPKIIINSLNYFFDQLIPLIEEHGGSLDKLIGDCIMAVFENREDYNGADGALQAAMAMQARLKTLRPQMEAVGMPEFHVGFGVNTGECVVGNVGTSDQLSRTVLGDAVNLAARVESLSKEGKSTCVLFTEYTKQSLRLKVEHSFLMETIVKGKSVPVSIYEVEESELDRFQEDSEEKES
jgi:adenylate cyclase